MIDEILRELVTLEDIEDAISECVLIWAHTAEAQREHKTALMQSKRPRNVMLLGTVHRIMTIGHLNCRRKWRRCKCCGTVHAPRQCPVCGQNVW